MNESTLHRRNFLLHLQERAGYNQQVLIKEPVHKQPSRSHLDQLHNEYTITKQLSEVTGVRPAYAMQGTESQPALLLEYIPGKSLAELIRAASLDMTEKLLLAVNLAMVLNRIHDKQVMHKDINSSNILVADNDMAGSQSGLFIIDFGLASNMQQENPMQLTNDDILVGTLAYISPEQTGRMNRQVDYRTDLYSLGITLYELFTGQLPYGSGDALETIHAHIARKPNPPHQIDAGIPDPVSDIILKLMAKNAEDRYQTAQGLQIDLQHCLDQYQATGQIELSELGTDDFTGRLQIPQKLYGRETEIDQLQAVLDRAVSGSAQLLLVAGYSGVGKTALVHEIQKDIIAKQAFFIEGKFDQLQRTLPYSAWAQAITQLVNSWLADSETRLSGWRKAILEAVGDHGQILIDIIPALEQIIGPQPEAPQLGGLESLNRFNYIFNRFINGLATPDHPLVVFLDDLQWIDPASLNLIESLLAVQTSSSLLIIGAYRDNEVDPDHPLTVSHERLRDEGKPVAIITLKDLTPAHTNHMLADTLQLSVDDCRELSQVLVEKTAGNPFYFRQLLYALESDGLLRFDRGQRRWLWDETGLQNIKARGSVVDLMIEKLQALPVETQQTLSMAACIGNRFKTSTLDTISGRAQMDILSNLNPALQNGLIVRSNGHFTFVHDRIQEAGYSLIPQADLPKTHLEIGRLLLADITDEVLEEEIFAIVGHLNAGQTLIDIDSEKIKLVKLNFKAGQRASNSSAFSDAKTYLEIALKLLGPDCWQAQYDLTLSLYNELAEVISYMGQYNQITPIADQIHSNAPNIIDRIRIYMVQINAATATGDFSSAVKIGINVLTKLGYEIPSQPSSEDHQGLQKRLKELLKGNPNETISGLPKMTDENALAASTIIISMMTATFATRPDIYCVIGLTGGILTLEHGVFPWSPHFFGQLGSIFWVAEDHGTPSDHLLDSLLWNKQMQEVVLNMIKDPYFKPSSARALEGVYHNGAFCRPMEENIELAKRALTTGFEVGDLLFAAHGPFFVAMYGIVTGMNLDKFQRQMIEYIALLRSVNQTIFETWISNYLQAAINFKETSEEPPRLVGEYFDEDSYLSAAEAGNDMTGRHFYYAIKILIAYHFNADNKLSGLIEESEKFIHAGMGLITVGITRTYAALSKLRLFPTLTPQDQKEALEIVKHSLLLMEIWSQTAPSTFQHLYDLIRAEKARVTGDTDKALDFYEQAIQGAHEVGFTNDEALANELYARFWAERDNDRFASQLMREAHSLYRKWGAHAKAEHLEKHYPNWLIGPGIGVNQPGTQTISTDVTSDLDLHTVLEASREIASEIALESLLAKLMNVIIKNAGAQKGFLIMEKGGQWIIEAEGGIDSSEISLLQSQDINLNDAVSSGIVNYVARTQDNVVLDNAANEGDFTGDEGIQQRQAKSVLCTPLINQGRVSGILYLENNLVTGAFTSERVELLNLLSSQMAMALDNAQLYANLEERVEERTKELKESQSQLVQSAKMATLGQLTAGIAHEINNPVSFTQASSFALDQDLEEISKLVDKYRSYILEGKQDKSEIEDFEKSIDYQALLKAINQEISDIKEGTTRTSEIVKNLREFSHESHGEMESVDIHRGIDATLNLLKSRFTKDITLTKKYDKSLGPIKCHIAQLNQVFMNLLSNALDAIDKKGEIVITTKNQGNSVKISISDNGRGIPEGEISKIFDPFFTTKKIGQGVGLGLSISHKIISDQGGSISVVSDQKKETRFDIIIPIVK